jgi:hypothetical protein
MTFAGISYPAVVIAAFLAWLASAVWYTSLARLWIAALGKTPQQAEADGKKPGAFLPYIYALVGNLVIAWALAGLLGHLGAGQVTLRNGVISGAFCWVGFILPTMAVNYSFGSRDRRLLLIDAGNWLISLIIVGAVVGIVGA